MSHDVPALPTVEHRRDQRTNRTGETLTHVLQIFSYHIGLIMTDPAGSRFGLGIFAGGLDETHVHVQVEIRPASAGLEPVWDQVWIDGKSCGNRCGGRDEYARLCGPVIAAVAAAELEQSERSPEGNESQPTHIEVAT